MRRKAVLLSLAALAAAALAPSARAAEIPGTPGNAPAFIGAPAEPHPIASEDPPRHPFMAPNGRSNIHDDAYQTDTYQGYGPLGRGGIRRTSTLFAAECASVTFDSKGRIVTVCVGLTGITLRLMDPRSLATLASYDLPGRDLTAGNPFTNFSGGGYFYLDDKDRAVIPTTARHILVIGETAAPGFKVEADHDLSGVVPDGDSIISALPDWSGRLWFASKAGVVGNVDPASGAVHGVSLGEPIGNSFAIDEDGGVYIVTDAAMYRFDAGADGAPQQTWRETYENVGAQKPGQTQAGSGTTPTLLGRDLVAITDNADPMNVVVYRRGRSAPGDRVVCRQPVFAKGASDTDQSLIAFGRGSFIAENNFGYASPASTELGRTTTPGLARVDLDASGTGCHTAWTSTEIAPSVVPKLALAAGLVYTYTKPARADGSDPWYLTALDVRDGSTVSKALAGGGLGFNNNYAPVTLGPDATAYVGVLGGLVALRDVEPPPPLPAAGATTTTTKTPKARLRLACTRAHRVRARVTGAGIRRVDFSAGGRRTRDMRRPFAATVRGRHGSRVVARVTFGSGVRRTLRATLPRCA